MPTPIQPMLCHRYPTHCQHISWPTYIQPKLNGIRAIMTFDPDEGFTWQSRSHDLEEPKFWAPHVLSHITELFKNKFKRKVILDGERVDLTPKEYDLLHLLASNPGRTYTREQLLSILWGYQYNGYEHTVNSHINRLRSKIESDLSNPKYILTSWGVGYRFYEIEEI